MLSAAVLALLILGVVLRFDTRKEGKGYDNNSNKNKDTGHAKDIPLSNLYLTIMGGILVFFLFRIIVYYALKICIDEMKTSRLRLESLKE